MSTRKVYRNQEPKPKPWQYWAFLILLGAIIATLFLTSCSPRIIEHVVVQHDTTRVVKVDSIWNYQHDSVFVKERGDTVYKYVEHIRYRDRVKVDTFIRVKVDSVAVERIKEVKIDKPLSWWQSFKIGAFPWLLLALGAALLYIFRKPILAIIKTLFLI